MRIKNKVTLVLIVAILLIANINIAWAQEADPTG